jgi:hypothetical protein
MNWKTIVENFKISVRYCSRTSAVYWCIISLSVVIKILFVLVDVENRALRHRPILEVRVSLVPSSWYKKKKKKNRNKPCGLFSEIQLQNVAAVSFENLTTVTTGHNFQGG